MFYVLYLQNFNQTIRTMIYFSNLLKTTKLKAISTLSLLLFFGICSLQAQMTINGQDYYGNEWIDYSKQYATIDIDTDGYYRVTSAQLTNVGFPINGKAGSELQLYRNGQPVPISVSTNGAFGASDYIEFYGERNDGWMDQFLFESASQRLNPDYSMYTDNSRYFLTFGVSNPLRYETIINSLTDLPAKEEYYMHTEEIIFSENHSGPYVDLNRELSFSHYQPAEGFGSQERNAFDYNIPAGAKYTGSDAPSPYLTVRQGIYFLQHQTEVIVNDVPRMLRNANPKTVDEYTVPLQIGDIINNVNIKLNGLGVTELHKKSILAKLGITYPRLFQSEDSDAFSMELPSSSSERYFEIENFNFTSNTVVLDVTNNRVLVPVANGSGIRFRLPSSTTASQIHIVNLRSQSANIDSKQYVDYKNLSGDYLMLTSESLNSGTNSAANQYKAYRESEEGGSHVVNIINAEDIIDQYGYGTKGHSLAIQNFIREAGNSIEGLEFVFMFGKGLDYASYRKDPAFELPTWGYPGSDNLLISYPGKISPQFKVGRLAVRSQESALQYLEKVKDHEDISEFGQTVEERAWMKKIIHLSGGSQNESETILNFLNQMADIIENSKFGADVHTYQKTSSDDIQTATSDVIKQDINDGAALITFFGHSSTGTFDFSIEEPSEYENKGKLPIILSLGCHSGDIFAHSFGLSEKFVTEPEVGSIAFLAASGNAQLIAQAVLGLEFYRNLGGDLYSDVLGTQTKEIVEYLEDGFINDFNFLTLMEQFTVHGDPALDMLSLEGADYIPTIDNVSTQPEQLSSNLDSLDLTFEVFNVGCWKEDSLNYMIIHDFEEEIDTFYGTTSTPPFSKLITHRLPVNQARILGRNEFDIVIDQNLLIDEVPLPDAENNNRLSLIYGEGYVTFAFDGTAKPISPQEYAMVVDSDITLRASTDNAFLASSDYSIQIDTTELFDSPLLLETTVQAYGGLVEWKPSVNYQSNTVYYWRVKSKESQTDEWKSSSFIFYPEKGVGWNQSHYYQQQDLSYNGLELLESRIMDFTKTPREHKITNQSRAENSWPAYFLDSDLIEVNYDTELFSPDITSGIYVSVIDPETSEPWSLAAGGDSSCAYTPATILGGRDRKAWPFFTFNPARRNCFLDFIENEIPGGHFVIIYTIQSTAYSYDAVNWAGDEAIYGRSIISVFESEGATEISKLAEQEVPYIFAYQKGVGPLTEVIANTPGDIITGQVLIDGKGFSGEVSSTLIGPAASWETLEWAPLSSNENDEYSVSIIGIDQAGEEIVLAENLTENTVNLSNINAEDYPYLQLSYSADDISEFTAASLDYWRIYYIPLPEAVINPNGDNFAFNAPILTKGELLTLDYQVQNISETDMSEMLVSYNIVGDNNQSVAWQQRYDILPSNTEANYSMEFNTTDLPSGKYDLQVTVNPNDDQPELYFFNNVGIIKFEISGNDLNPLLDVTFDGIRIENGDIVSPSPEIEIVLTEDNLYSLLEDPELFTLILTGPDGNTQIIDINGPDVEFIPATAGGDINEATLIYTPTLDAGDYTLSVQAVDNAGNLSGDNGYIVDFIVVLESRINSFTNYPNPFSESTRFVYSATGDDLPETFALIIFNDLGQAVQTVTQDDFQLPTGRDRTYYIWDGTDSSGNELPNGIYYYRLFIDKNESVLFDKDFAKGSGKIIMVK